MFNGGNEGAAICTSLFFVYCVTILPYFYSVWPKINQIKAKIKINKSAGNPIFWSKIKIFIASMLCILNTHNYIIFNIFSHFLRSYTNVNRIKMHKKSTFIYFSHFVLYFSVIFFIGNFIVSKLIIKLSELVKLISKLTSKNILF